MKGLIGTATLGLCLAAAVSSCSTAAKLKKAEKLEMRAGKIMQKAEKLRAQVAEETGTNSSLVNRSEKLAKDVKRLSSAIGNIVYESGTADAGIAVSEVKNYFVRNDVSEYGTLVFDSEKAFEDYFGMATTMSPDGKPTAIDFSKQRVVCISCSPSTDDVEIKFLAFVLNADELRVKYSRKKGSSHPSYTSVSCKMAAVSGALGKKIVFEEVK